VSLGSSEDRHSSCTAHPPHVSPLSRPGTRPGIRPVIREHPVGGPAPRSRFPAAFQPPAFAFWASCSRHGIQLPSRSACRCRPNGRHRTLTGFPRFPRLSYGRVGLPLYPGDDGVPTTIGKSVAAACRLTTAGPYHPSPTQPTRDVMLTRHQQGFNVVSPFGLPLACDTRSERAPLGFPLSFAPSRYQPRTSGRGQIWNTDLKSRLRLKHNRTSKMDGPTQNVRHRVALYSHAARRAGWAGVASRSGSNG
jgi:hypothetical protein